MHIAHSETLRRANKNLELLEVFLLKYSDKLPDEFHGSASTDGPSLGFCLEHECENRERILCLIGDIFGRNDWKATLEYGGRCYYWRKTVDDVIINLWGVQKVDAPEEFPVSPKQFPLQLSVVAA